jgi:hypothetical protein
MLLLPPQRAYLRQIINTVRHIIHVKNIKHDLGHLKFVGYKLIVVRHHFKHSDALTHGWNEPCLSKPITDIAEDK